MAGQLIGMDVATDDMIGLHRVDVSGRHSSKDGDSASEENDRFHDCL